jgi:hypothetical protein
MATAKKAAPKKAAKKAAPKKAAKKAAPKKAAKNPPPRRKLLKKLLLRRKLLKKLLLRRKLLKRNNYRKIIKSSFLLSAEIDYKVLSDFRGGFFFVLSLMHSF